jgi:uncharacterized protein (UPF0335 family)
MQLRRSAGKCVRVGVSREIFDLAGELNISFDVETVRMIIGLGKKSVGQEAELERALKRLEEEKNRLASDFREIASQRSQLEAAWVGARNRFAGVSRDNRVLAMHLSARAVSGVRKERLRRELIQKYILNYRDT